MLGPAPYDDAWAHIGEYNEFFSGNGYTWYEMMHVPPKGNPHVLLAHQYIAAQLNFLAGADPAAILTDFGQATALLSVYTVDYDWKTDPDGVADDLRDLAEILGDYNDGSIGPGLCGS